MSAEELKAPVDEQKAEAPENTNSVEAPGNVVIHLENIVKKYYIGSENELEVLHGISLDIREGELTSIVGESGSGKSTLMNIIGLLDKPTEGNYTLLGENVETMKDAAVSRIRGLRIGFVFQNYNLIPRMSALAEGAGGRAPRNGRHEGQDEPQSG